MELGVIRAGALDGLKARLLLTPCQAADDPVRRHSRRLCEGRHDDRPGDGGPVRPP